MFQASFQYWSTLDQCILQQSSIARQDKTWWSHTCACKYQLSSELLKECSRPPCKQTRDVSVISQVSFLRSSQMSIPLQDIVIACMLCSQRSLLHSGLAFWTVQKCSRNIIEKIDQRSWNWSIQSRFRNQSRHSDSIFVVEISQKETRWSKVDGARLFVTSNWIAWICIPQSSTIRWNTKQSSKVVQEIWEKQSSSGRKDVS